MKKKLLMLLSILVLSSSIGMAYSKPASNTELSNAIRLYKAGNYSECYTKLNTIINRGYYRSIITSGVSHSIRSVTVSISKLRYR